MFATNDVTYGYGRDQPPIISGFSHDFEPGVTVIGGPSGCGKSTLLYLLGLMLTPVTGTITLDGRSVSKVADLRRSRIRARDIGFVFQDAVLDPSRTVLDNVTEAGLYAGLDRTESQERARSLLKHFGVMSRETHRPGEISGGQAQRVALCRALLKRPRIILADEPTGNLDAQSAQVVWGALEKAGDDGACVVIATHDSERLAAASSALVLR